MSFETLRKSFQDKSKFHVLDRNQEHNGTILPEYDVNSATYIQTQTFLTSNAIDRSISTIFCDVSFLKDLDITTKEGAL